MTSLRRLASLAFPVLLLTGCSSMPDPFGWFESDNQEPPAELTDYEPGIVVKELWSQDSGAGSDGQYLKLVPALYQGRIVTADGDGQVHSIDAETGKTVWQVDTEAPISGGPGAGDGLVLVGTRSAELIALNEENGEPAWRTRLSSEVLSVPRISEGIVVVHTIDGKLYGLESAKGVQKWVYDRTAPILTLRGNGSPVIEDEYVIAGMANGKLVNVQLASGIPEWEVTITAPRGRSELERIVDIDADPVVEDGVIYVSTYQGDVAAVSLDTGVVLWRRPLSSHAGLSADWRGIYVTDEQDQVWALDPENGAALWKQEKLLNRQLTTPAIFEDHIVVGDLEGYVHWLSYEDGSQQARIRITSAPIKATPVVYDDRVVVLADDGTLAVIAPPKVVDGSEAP